MQPIDMAGAIEHAHRALCALTQALEQADLPTPRMQRTLAAPARGGDGRSYTVEVVLRVECEDDG